MSRVVLLHAGIGDSRLWARQVPALAPHFEVVAPDLPGFGETPEPDEPFSLVDLVAAHLPAALVGNSFGGMVALRTALAHPDRVSKLVLVAPAFPGWDFGEQIQAYWAAEEAAVARGDLAAATEVNLEFWVAPEHRDEVRPQQLRALELQTAHEEPEVRWPQLAPLSSLTVPTLVVIGERDVDDFRAIAAHVAGELPDADLAVVPGAGHLVGLDRPDELNALLLEFLEN